MPDAIGFGYSGTARCADIDEDAGQCQLLASHHPYQGPHAARVLDAYLTWKPNGAVVRWSVYSSPWLFDLPWAPGYQPIAAAAS
jgi:hypothetical protein